jgi:hypothetical protein
VAGNRLERILQAFLCSQNEPGPTKNITPYGRRILAYAQDVDGKIEGPVPLIL